MFLCLIKATMTTLFLMRHGETEDNVARIMQGQRHGVLTSVGVAQIEEVAISLMNIHFDAIISSDLLRAYDSGMIFAKKLNFHVTITPLLRERDWGDFTGRHIPDLKGLPLPENVEKMDDLLSRAKKFLDWVKAHYPNMVVLAVGHGIINKAIQAVHYGKRTREIPKMQNAEYRILYI